MTEEENPDSRRVRRGGGGAPPPTWETSSAQKCPKEERNFRPDILARKNVHVPLKAHALLANNTQHCWAQQYCDLLRPFAWNHNNVGTCWHLLALVAYSLKPVKLLAQQVPTFPILLFCDRRSVAQQCCVRFHGTATMLANIGLGKTSAHAPCNNFFKKQTIVARFPLSGLL